jgi:hypothetical protein
VSLFLCVCLRRDLRCGWRRLAKLVAGEHGAGWRRLSGFRDGDTPSASGLRYFFTTVGPEVFEELCPLFTDMLRQTGLLPEHSTFPGDPPERGVTISHDIMLDEARSRMRCGQVTDTCYRPAPRPCPAQAEGREGCDCTDPACALACRWTTPLDPEARLIHYAGRNRLAPAGQVCRPRHPARHRRPQRVWLRLQSRSPAGRSLCLRLDHPHRPACGQRR